jgi:hypothetical protein
MTSSTKTDYQYHLWVEKTASLTNRKMIIKDLSWWWEWAAPQLNEKPPVKKIAVT